MSTSISMQGKVAVIIGGTKGIGKATALALTERGATVAIVGRNREAGEAALRELRTAHSGSRTGDDTGDFFPADISLMSEVRRLAEAIKSRFARLDVLVHSADVLRLKRAETVEGLELSFATNYLSRFLLNHLLLDQLKASGTPGEPSRIIHVAAAGIPGKLDLSQVPPRPDTSSFTGHNVGQKANDMYAIEVAARLRRQGSANLTINVMNPGIVDTEIRRSSPDTRRHVRLMVGLMELLKKPVTQTPAQFAEQVVRLATAPELAGESGGLWDRKGKALAIRPESSNVEIRRQLWEVSERLVGITPGDHALLPRDDRPTVEVWTTVKGEPLTQPSPSVLPR